MYAKVLPSGLVCCVTVPTSLTWCKTKLAISAHSYLGLHNKYTVKVVASSKITAEMNMKMSMMQLSEKKFC